MLYSAGCFFSVKMGLDCPWNLGHTFESNRGGVKILDVKHKHVPECLKGQGNEARKRARAAGHQN